MMKRYKIVYKNYSEAVEKLYATVQSYLPYTLVCGKEEDDAYHTIWIGVTEGVCGYKIVVDEKQRVEITAEDEANLLYAVSDFKNIYLPFNNSRDKDRVVDFYVRKPFLEPLKPVEISSCPRIKRRGLWTWGHTIYDYKKYIDNMVTLKLNTLIIWNDFVPVNIGDVIDYAHDHGVKIYLGFAWGWDTSDVKVNISDTLCLTEHVVNKYQKEYKNLSCDGIYFQSFTEKTADNIDGVNIADAVITFVNRTAEKIFEMNPECEILFGLHAMSVLERIEEFKKIDERISIIWEDLGAFPYHNSPSETDGFTKTKELNIKIRDLRDAGFGCVLKSNYRLNWFDFEHQAGPYIMGVTEEKVRKKKLDTVKPLLRTIQADWIKNAELAKRLISDFNEDSIVTVLAEDGMFEECITYPMALYAQMMWDCERPTEEIMHQAALMPDVDFV
ncbi:MAG: hypothetical protein IJA08_05950 [Clostridia bacterium]|nr:hypothetical protein [Clostridia bacterium]